MPSIEQVISMIGDWKDRKLEYAPLGGGITNHNYKVTIEGEKFMVRIPGVGSDLFIDRENELECSVQAGKTGVSPEVVYHIREENVSVFRFISGKTLNTEQIAGSNQLVRRIVQAARTVHQEAVFTSTFNPFETVRKYMGFVEKYRAPLPKDIDWILGVGDEIERVMKQNKPEEVACHNDYLSENFIDDGKKVWIIDWEYGGMGDPYFDLGDFAVEHPFTREQEELIIQEYCGEADKSGLYRMLLYKIVSDLWWGIWAMIQSRVSKIDFDFYVYGNRRFERLRNNARDDDYQAWLKGV
jgi:thiamine kinase-like enzyme